MFWIYPRNTFKYFINYFFGYQKKQIQLLSLNYLCCNDKFKKGKMFELFGTKLHDSEFRVGDLVYYADGMHTPSQVSFSLLFL